MLAYQGKGDEVQIDGLAPGPWMPGEYVLAWEDLDSNAANYDGDFTDMVLMIESVTPVPEPATTLLLVLGAGGALVGIRRRRKEIV